MSAYLSLTIIPLTSSDLHMPSSSSYDNKQGRAVQQDQSLTDTPHRIRSQIHRERLEQAKRIETIMLKAILHKSNSAC